MSGMRHPELQNRDWLNRKYTTEGNNIYDIAKIIGCAPSTVAKALTKHSIFTRMQFDKTVGTNICKNSKCRKEFNVGGRNNPPRNQLYCSRHCHVVCQHENEQLVQKRGVNFDENEQVCKANKARYFRTGVDAMDYDQMYKEQNGLCAICNEEETTTSSMGNLISLAVDHDHKTGLVRKLLCRRCNVLIGSVDDDPKILTEAIHYLNKHNSNPSGIQTIDYCYGVNI